VDHGEGTVAEFGQSQVGFPGFEERFDSPAKAVNDGQLLRRPDVRGDIGEEDVPAEQVEVLLAGIQRRVAILSQFAAAVIGDRIGHGHGHQTHRDAVLCAQQWAVTFTTVAGAVYSLERFADLNTWTDLDVSVSGDGQPAALADPAPPADRAFYRLRCRIP